MSYQLSLAVMADWLPKLDPPVGGNGFYKPYGDRLKLQLEVEPTETLAEVYQRAIDQLQPRVSVDSQSHPENLLSVLHWVWFYEPADEEEGGFSRKAYARPEDLILIDASGRARWNVPMGDLPYADIIRAGEHGLIRGDPLRPYIAFMQPQGGGELQCTWEAALVGWKVLEQLLIARGGLALGAEIKQRMLERLRGRRVVEAHSAAWIERGGDPQRIKMTVDSKSWSLEDLRIVMGVPTADDARYLLLLFGQAPTPDGDYEIGTEAEARLLRLVEDDVFETLVQGRELSEAELEARLAHIMETGERPLPSYDW